MPLANFGFLLPADVRSDFGFQSGLTFANPAAGASFVRTTPGEFFEVYATVLVTLTTNAVVANRLLEIVASDGDGKTQAISPSDEIQPASGVVAYQFSLATNAVSGSIATNKLLPLFPFVFPSGWKLQIVVVNMQAGDQLSGVGCVVQQYNTGIEPERFRDVSPLGRDDVGFSLSTPVSGQVQPVTVAPTFQAPSAAPAVAASAPTPAPAPAPAVTPFNITPEQVRVIPETQVRSLPTPQPIAPTNIDMGTGSSAGGGSGISRI